MEITEHLARARKAHTVKATERRNRQMFQLAWRSSEPEHIVGWEQVCSRLNLKENTLRSRLSTGKGTVTLKRVNPLTGEPDMLTVSRLTFAEVKPRRGRPPLRVDLERLGVEYVEQDTTPLVVPPKPVNKVPSYIQKLTAPKAARKLPKVKAIRRNSTESSRNNKIPRDDDILP